MPAACAAASPDVAQAQAPQRPHFIFLAGIEKGGTTALAEWLVSNGLARFAVAGIKEPHTYLSAGAVSPPPAALPWLDASVSYLMSREAIARLPQQRTRIVLCLRNPLERAWSAYRMKKIAALGGDAAAALLTDYIRHAGCVIDGARAGERTTVSFLNVLRDIATLAYPRGILPQIQRYFAAEAARLRSATFAERTAYELAFLQNRGHFPFLSVLQGSFCHPGLEAVTARYRAQDILLVSLGRLRAPACRDTFVRRLLGTAPATGPVPFAFSSAGLTLEEPRPDFTDAQWSALRTALGADARRCAQLLATRGIATDLLDPQALSHDQAFTLPG